MATLVHQCPHPDCMAERMTFEVVAITNKPDTNPLESRSFAYLYCRKCQQPSVVEITDGKRGGIATTMVAMPQDLATYDWRVTQIWPAPPVRRVPDHLPSEVARAFLAAERNFLAPNMEEASAGSYGRALELATKAMSPAFAKQSLFNRIELLAKEHRITPDLAAWAHAIRSIRNGALHDVDRISRDELIAIRGFTEMLLTYLFTLPGMLKARQADTSEKPAE